MNNKLKAVCFNLDEKDQSDAYDKAMQMDNFSLFVRTCLNEIGESEIKSLSKKDFVKDKIKKLRKKLTDKSLHRSTHHRIEKKIEQLEQSNENG